MDYPMVKPPGAGDIRGLLASPALRRDARAARAHNYFLETACSWFAVKP